VTFKFWELLKNASEVTLVLKNIFFLKILNLVQSFVECKVSLADGITKGLLWNACEKQHSRLHASNWPASSSLLQNLEMEPYFPENGKIRNIDHRPINSATSHLHPFSSFLFEVM
jgi:hypothetical protein